MVGVYVLVMLVVQLLSAFYLHSTYKNYFYESEKVKLFAKANIVSSMIAENGIEDTRFLATSTRDLFSDSPVRMMILSKQAIVVYDNDSQNSAVNKFFIKDTIKTALAGENDSNTFSNSDGTNSIDVAIPVLDENSEAAGIVYLRKSLSSIDDFLNDLSSTIYRISVLIIVLVALLSIFFSGVITKPLVKLTSVTAEIAKGNFDQEVTIKGRDELAVLGKSVNTMSKQLADVEESRKVFVSDVSHELKTPLATIKLLSESILQSPTFDEEIVREFLGDMTNEVDRLTRIIERLLNLSKNDAEVKNINFETVNVTKLLELITRKLKPLADEKNIAIKYEHAQDQSDIEMLMDKDKIYEAIYNIVDNSIKYTPEGGAVSVRLVSDIVSLMIEVEDNGIGIPKEDSSKIFDRFYRVDKARARETGGTGLGLAIAAEAINQHGGHIEVISEEGVGSKFIIILPFSGK